MKKGALNFLSAFLIILLMVMLQPACKKRLEKSAASAVVDRISMHYGNERIYNGFNLGNTGEENLTYQVTEEIPWLEVANPAGEVAGQSTIEITCIANRTGLTRGNYSGKINLQTSSKEFTLDVYMNVNMFLVTFINPVYTIINLKIDTLLISPDTNTFSRNIGKKDSVQFGFFQPPDIITYYAQTSGRYTDSTQLGLMMEWEGQQFVSQSEMPRYSLDVSKAFFHLSIINTNQVLSPLFVNAGSPFETIENIFVFQSSEALPIGYYHALNNTVIRAFVAGQSSTITWSNNGQFELPFTINQAVVIDTYSNDTLKKKAATFNNQRVHHHNNPFVDEGLIHLIGSPK
jgi:hypothetical protein